MAVKRVKALLEAERDDFGQGLHQERPSPQHPRLPTLLFRDGDDEIPEYRRWRRASARQKQAHPEMCRVTER
jgi:hypothetical protein